MLYVVPCPISVHVTCLTIIHHTCFNEKIPTPFCSSSDPQITTSMAVRLAGCLKKFADVLEYSNAILTRTLSVVTSVAGKTREEEDTQLKCVLEALQGKNTDLQQAQGELHQAFFGAQPS